MARITEITDITAPELAVFARLTEAQLRSRAEPEMGIFIAESPKVIRTALDAGFTAVSLLMERSKAESQAADILERCPEVPAYTADREVLARLTGYEMTRGVLCAMKRGVRPSVEEVCRDARRLAVLEGVVDSTNMGAIFRSAAALGMDGVLLTKTCCDPLLRRAIRVSMGTVFQIPWTYLDENWLSDLHELGFQTVAMALSEDSVPVDDPILRGQERLAVVLGTEGDGLARQTIARCDYTARIPMRHGVDSLNVAAAGAVAFWQLGK